MSGLIDIAQNMCDNINSKVKERPGKGTIYYKPITFKDSIIKIYSTFEGPKDFLRIPNGDKIEGILTSDNCVFLGAYLNGHLAGISYLKEIPENYPFFRAPLSENGNNKVFTFGGLYVRPECEGFGSATGMVNILTQSARTYINTLKQSDPTQRLQQGVFFEADYRNIGSLSVLSRHGNYIGFYVDEKRLEGPTIMLYDSFSSKPIPVEIPTLHVPNDKEQGILNLTQFTGNLASQVGGMQEYTIPFDDQANHMTVLNNIPKTLGNGKTMFDFEKEYTGQFVNYEPGEAREVMTGSREEVATTLIEMPPRFAEVKTPTDEGINPIENMEKPIITTGVKTFASTIPCFETIGSIAMKLDDTSSGFEQ